MAIVIDDARINSFVGMPALVREFPMLLAMKEDPKACCGQPRRTVNYEAIKASLGGMPTDRQELFKTMIGTDRCRVIFRVANSVMTIDF